MNERRKILLTVRVNSRDGHDEVDCCDVRASVPDINPPNPK